MVDNSLERESDRELNRCNALLIDLISHGGSLG